LLLDLDPFFMRALLLFQLLLLDPFFILGLLQVEVLLIYFLVQPVDVEDATFKTLVTWTYLGLNLLKVGCKEVLIEGLLPQLHGLPHMPVHTFLPCRLFLQENWL
jgi:hypothetical protein